MEVILTQENFEQEVLQSQKPVLVDFWASWCGPCRMLAPVIEEIAEKNEDIKVGKVNVDEQPELAQKYGISSIPALYFFREGEVVHTSIGLQPRESIEAQLKVLRK